MSALCVIKMLKKQGHRVIGCDIYPKEWHIESSLCDVFEQAPLAQNDKEYVQFIISFAKKNKADLIFPLTDLEIDILNRQRFQLEKENLLLCCSSSETLNIVRDKYLLYNFFVNSDIVLSIPTFIHSDNLLELKFPCIAKPKDGRSSEGLMIIEKQSELSNIIGVERYIFQQKIEGTVCTVDYVRDPYGTDMSVLREELLRTKNGAGTTVRMFNDPLLKTLVSYIGTKLNIKGVVNMEFIRNTRGYYLIDINPRFSAGIAFSCKVGYDFISAHLNCFINKSIPSKIHYDESILVKYFVES